MYSRLILSMGAALIALAAGGAVKADDDDVALDKLPKAVLAAVKAKFPTLKVVKASKEEEDGKTVYEIEMKDGDRSVDAIFLTNGTLVQVEREIEASRLPKAVTAAIEAKFPKATLKKAEEVTEGDEVTYEVHLTTADQKSVAVTLDPKGKILETEKDD